MIKTALALIQALKHFRSRISELDRNGQDTTEYRKLSHGTIQVLCDVLEGSTKPESAKPLLEALDRAVQSGTIDGGPGSGNHGHKGVKGQRGGSAPSGNSATVAGSVSATGENEPCVGFASKSKLRSHTRRHGPALGITSEAEYQQKGIDFLKQPCGGDVIGYAASDGKVVRFNTKTTEYATGYPGDRLCTYMKPKAKKDGTANPEAAMSYYNLRKGESE